MALTGRCYCGAVTLTASAEPQTVAYCHCADCRRWTGAPLPAFAAFDPDILALAPEVEEVAHPSGVTRRNCAQCGSPLTARFPYLPGQVYVPLGLLDQAGDFAPEVHCHAENAYDWLHQSDGLPREVGSARDKLQEART